LFGVPRHAANGFGAMELGICSRRSELMELVVKSSYRFMCVDVEGPVKQCCEWQKISMNMRNGAKDLIVEL